jgi:hypothetical protein
MITTVRINVARSDPTFATPTLAKTAVSAANAADPKAQGSQPNEGEFISYAAPIY